MLQLFMKRKLYKRARRSEAYNGTIRFNKQFLLIQLFRRKRMINLIRTNEQFEREGYYMSVYISCASVYVNIVCSNKAVSID